MGLMEILERMDSYGTPESPNVYSDPDTGYIDQYNTPIPADKMQDYLKWIFQNSMKSGHDVTRDKADYDVQGAALSDMKTAANGHGTDQFKKPNHATFSTGSQYNGVDGYQGGTWGAKSFTPSATNLRMESPEWLSRYFDRVEPGVSLNMPTGGRVMDVKAGLMSGEAPWAGYE